MRIYKIKTLRLVLPILLLMCIFMPGTGWSVEAEQVSVGPINTAFAIMSTGQSKTYTVNSDFFPALMIISLVVNATGTIQVSVTKTDTTGELIGVMQIGAYSSVPNSESVKYKATVGVTPCTIKISGRFWEFGFGIITSGLVASLEPGPHIYTITISY